MYTPRASKVSHFAHKRFQKLISHCAYTDTVTVKDFDEKQLYEPEIRKEEFFCRYEYDEASQKLQVSIIVGELKFQSFIISYSFSTHRRVSAACSMTPI